MQSAQRRQSQVGREFCVLLSVLVYFCIPRRGAVQIAHTSVLPFGTSAMICSYRFYFYALWFLLFFLFDTCTEPLNRSQTWRPDPFRLSAVTTRGLCVYLSWDLLSLFSGTLDIQSQRNAKQLEPGWRVSASSLNNIKKFWH